MDKITILSETPESRVELHENEDGRTFVRKISQNPNYNQKLRREIEKQHKFYDRNLAALKTPKIYFYEYLRGLFFADMERIKAQSVADTIVSHSRMYHRLWAAYLCNNLAGGTVSSGNVNVLREIETVDRLLWEKNIPVIRAAVKTLYEGKEQITVHLMSNHGNLSFDNILLSDTECQLIDFGECFCECAEADYATLLLDSMFCCSFRNKDIDSDARQMLDALTNDILESYAKDYGDPTDLYKIMLLKVLRTYVCSKEESETAFLDNILIYIMRKIRQLALRPT